MSDRHSSRSKYFPEILDLLNMGELRESHGLLPWGSNYTFLMNACRGADEKLVIYKPRRGERPLWDFLDGSLCLREMAAFVVSEALSWHVVPPTTLRNGPQGFGIVQYYVEHDPDKHYFTFSTEHIDQIEAIALFDHLINNADRKAGHCLLDNEGCVWGIDHGICFHSQPKLRTVIWDFAGKTIPLELLADLKLFLSDDSRDAVSNDLSRLLSAVEIRTLYHRAESLVRTGRYPEPGPGRQYPWPPI